MKFTKLILILAFSWTLFGCLKSDFDKCFEVEKSKLSILHQSTLTEGQHELVDDILPVLLRQEDLESLYYEYEKSYTEFSEKYIEEQKSLGKEIDWEAYDKVIEKAKRNFPHYKELNPLYEATLKAMNLIIEGEFKLHDPDMFNSLTDYCESVGDEGNRKCTIDFLVVSIKDAFLPNLTDAATEVCHTRGLY